MDKAKITGWVTLGANTLAALASTAAVIVAVRVLMTSQENVQLDRRPWLSVEGATLGDPEPKMFPTVSIEFHNSGKTPAYDVRIWAQTFQVLKPSGNDPKAFDEAAEKQQILLTPIHLKEDWPVVLEQKETDLGSDIAGAPISPGSSHTSNFTDDQALTQKSVAMLKRGELRIYAFGIMRYRDVDKTVKQTEFCTYANSNAIVNQNNQSIQVGFCPTGNNIDTPILAHSSSAQQKQVSPQ